MDIGNLLKRMFFPAWSFRIYKELVKPKSSAILAGHFGIRPENNLVMQRITTWFLLIEKSLILLLSLVSAIQLCLCDLMKKVNQKFVLISLGIYLITTLMMICMVVELLKEVLLV